MLAAACENVNCEGYVSMTNFNDGKTKAFTCSNCEQQISGKFLEEYKEVTQLSDIHLQNMKQTACIL